MLHTKIKFLFLACVSFITGSIYCWNNVVQNDTDGEIVVTIDYAAPGICSPENRIVKPHTSVTIDSKICCAQKVTVRATAGKTKGQSYSVDTPRAGLDMTCSSFSVRVYVAAGNVLMAEVTLT